MITKKNLLDMIEDLNNKYGINPLLRLTIRVGLSGNKYYIIEDINKITYEFGTKDCIYFYLRGLIDAQIKLRT